MKLCLDSLTLTDTEPVDLIHSARSAGFDLISLWVQPPALFPLPLVTREKARSCAHALAETGISVGPLEVFDLKSADAIESYRPALELGARLGAKTASAINLSCTDPLRASELFARLADMAGEFGLGITLEPLAMFATSTLAQARDVIRRSGVDAGIVVDAFHLIRMGGTAADISDLAPGLIRHVQLCDGPANATIEAAHYESVNERLYPGDGEFHLAELFADAPTDVSWSVEAPSRRRAEAGMSAEAQAIEVMAAMRRVISSMTAVKQS